MLIIDRAEIKKHIYIKVWNEIVSKCKEVCTIPIKIPAEELERWTDSYSEEITKICEKALAPFQERASEIYYIYVYFGGESKWLCQFSENEGAWYEMLCDEVLPSWMSRKTKWDFHPSIEDAMNVVSTKQGLHVYVTLCFNK